MRGSEGRFGESAAARRAVAAHRTRGDSGRHGVFAHASFAHTSKVWSRYGRVFQVSSCVEGGEPFVRGGTVRAGRPGHGRRHDGGAESGTTDGAETARSGKENPAGEGAGIPKQQSAAEAADSETGESARA
ncbi:hypothetical protein FGK60_44960 [Streptomyces sp. DASNCL29]|nr:hypothetical protein FGK60_44960 [Streptomyces sp. DASNCL29]